MMNHPLYLVSTDSGNNNLAPSVIDADLVRIVYPSMRTRVVDNYVCGYEKLSTHDNFRKKNRKIATSHCHTKSGYCRLHDDVRFVCRLHALCVRNGKNPPPLQACCATSRS